MNVLGKVVEVLLRIRRLCQNFDRRAISQCESDIRPLFVALDQAVTGKTKNPQDYDKSVREIIETGTTILYLADGGYSRLPMDVFSTPPIWITREPVQSGGSLPKAIANFDALIDELKGVDFGVKVW